MVKFYVNLGLYTNFEKSSINDFQFTDLFQKLKRTSMASNSKNKQKVKNTVEPLQQKEPENEQKAKTIFIKILPHLIAIVSFLVIISVYFNPLFENKTLQQHDVIQAMGAGHEASLYYKNTHEPVLWTNSMFSGMPTYQIWLVYPTNLLSYLTPVLELKLPSPMNLLFLYFICFYILLLVFEVKPLISFISSFAFAFSTYNLLIIEAGHVNKALAIGLVPLVLAGVFLVLRKKYLWGFILSAVALSLEIRANHFQITYYLFMMVVLLFLVEFIYSIRGKTLLAFIKSAAIVIVAFILAALVNITPLWINYDYSKYTMRGGTELRSKANNDKTQEKGLQRSYAYMWSYDKMETFTLLIPKFMGGGSSEPVGEKSNTYKALLDKGVGRSEAKNYCEKMPLYWGKMQSTSGPVYFGAIICYLFILGLLLVRNKIKWWLLAAFILSVLLSWGENFIWFSNLFFDYFPMYNKFRVPMTLLVIASICVPLMAALVLKEINEGTIDKVKLLKSLKNSFYVLGGILLFFMLFGGSLFDFSGVSDKEVAGENNQWLVDALKLDRPLYLRLDSLRSFIFIFIAVAAIFAYLKYKLKKEYLLAILALAVLVDMWAVNKRYFNNSDFVKRKRHNQDAIAPTPADEIILQDKSLSYRVLNLSVSPFNDATTSYFHKSVGGYSGAKLARYQDIIDNHLYPNDIKNLVGALNSGHMIPGDSIPVLNMLNTKYFILEQSQRGVVQNPFCYSNAWIVNEVKIVDNPDQEIGMLNKVDLKSVAVVDRKFTNEVGNYKSSADSGATINLIAYHPNRLTYKYDAGSENMVVFSEIYYDKGWKAFIDGKPAAHFRADYILRAMKVPAGKHKIEFKFEPNAYFTGEKISLASSLLIILLAMGGIYYSFFYKKQKINVS